VSDGYRVNTDELEAVVRRLRTLQQNINQTGTKSKYEAVVSRNDLGGEFAEAGKLYQAHDSMQGFLSRVIGMMDNLINEFGDKTQTVTDAYRAREDEGTAAMGGHQARLD
jgi:hypothetical protein